VNDIDVLTITTFRADGSYQQSTMAPPKRDGSGAGILVTDGKYRLTGPNTLGFQPLAMKACDTSGARCIPYPITQAPGGFSFDMDGPNRYRASGAVFYRMHDPIRADGRSFIDPKPDRMDLDADHRSRSAAPGATVRDLC
jgi:hypothetical protein